MYLVLDFHLSRINPVRVIKSQRENVILKPVKYLEEAAQSIANSKYSALAGFYRGQK